MEKHYAIPASLVDAIMSFFATCRPHEVARMIVAIEGLREISVTEPEGEAAKDGNQND